MRLIGRLSSFELLARVSQPGTFTLRVRSGSGTVYTRIITITPAGK